MSNTSRTFELAFLLKFFKLLDCRVFSLEDPCQAAGHLARRCLSFFLTRFLSVSLFHFISVLFSSRFIYL